MTRVAVATTSDLAARAGVAMAEAGGNAVDAAVAAIVVSMATEPGICSLGGGAFATIRVPGQPTVTIDGNVEMPGRGRAPDGFGGGIRELWTEYGGGTRMVIGHGTVATPGAVAALERAVDRYGALPWSAVLEPAIEIAEEGFPLGHASRYYLEYVHDDLFGWQGESYRAIHDGDRLYDAGEPVVVPGLADSLRLLARDGAAALHRGALGEAITTDILDNGGILSMDDLSAYEVRERPALRAEVAGWRLWTNPPPAIGGATMLAMLLLLGESPHNIWTPEDRRRMVEVQDAVLGHRDRHIDGADDVGAEVERLLALVEAGELPVGGSGSTVHTSAVDADGVACAVTASAGYGSGVMAPGTGIWLNNCLGEIELVPRGPHSLRPGTRVPTNMAPTVGAGPNGGVLAIGSPGADRITTAIVQTLANYLIGGMELQASIDHPRIHVRYGDEVVIGVEEPLELPGELPHRVRSYPFHAMFFGGVGVAELRADGELVAAADPRRDGSVAVGGA